MIKTLKNTWKAIIALVVVMAVVLTMLFVVGAGFAEVVDNFTGNTCVDMMPLTCPGTVGSNWRPVTGDETFQFLESQGFTPAPGQSANAALHAWKRSSNSGLSGNTHLHICKSTRTFGFGPNGGIIRPWSN